MKTAKLAKVTNQIKAKKKSQRGQGMTEYIIIVALIGVAAIGVYRLFGDTIRNQVAAMAQEVSGGDGTAQRNVAATRATAASATAVTNRNMGNFTNNNTP